MPDKQVIFTNSNIEGITASGRGLCRWCWNGQHHYCTHGQCECLCLTADASAARNRRVKPETLPLPDAGAIEVK